MFQFIAVIIMIIASVLVLAILMQNSKGGGLSGSFGSAAAAQVVGTRRTTEIIEKISWSLIGAFLVLCIVANLVLLSGKGKTNYKSKIGKGGTEQKANTPKK